MSIPDNVYTNEDGSVFVQEAPGKKPYYVGSCISVDAIPNPKAGKTPIWCLDDNRVFQTVGMTRSAPGDLTLSITSLTEKQANNLEKFAEDFCPFILHVTQSKCGSKGVFGNWERVYAVDITAMTEDTVNNLASREGGTATERAITLSAWPPRLDARRLNAGAQTAVSVQNFMDIWACPMRCADSGSSTYKTGYHAMIGAGTGALVPNTIRTVDRGVTWTVAAVNPYVAVTDIIMSGVCVEIDCDTTRHIMVRGTLAGSVLQTIYTDDDGATWSALIDVTGSAVADAATGPQAMCALDAEHIWLCTDAGQVFFSDDAGASWVEQPTALTASGAAALNAIDFINHNVGVAVGDTDTAIYTVDGGTTWQVGANSTGVNLLTVQVLDTNPIVTVVGDSAGDIFHSWDNLATWTETWGAGTSVACVSFCDKLHGLMIDNIAGPTAVLYHTVNGGYSWHVVATPTTTALNSCVLLAPFFGYAVGDISVANGVVLEINAI